MSSLRKNIYHRLSQENEVRKSISVEITWGVRFNDDAQVTEFLSNISAEVSYHTIEFGDFLHDDHFDS